LPPTELKRKQVRSGVLFILAVLVFAVLLGIFFKMQPAIRMTGRFQTVGDFPDDHAWFNTSVPLNLYDQLSGHVVVLLSEDFETLDDVTALSRLHDLCSEFADDPVQVVVIYRISEEKLTELYSQVEAWDFSFPMIIDDMNEVGVNFGINSVPALLLIDSTGRISGWFYEGWEDVDIEAIVRDLLMQGIASRTLVRDPFHPDGGEFIPERLRSLSSD